VQQTDFLESPKNCGACASRLFQPIRGPLAPSGFHISLQGSKRQTPVLSWPLKNCETAVGQRLAPDQEREGPGIPDGFPRARQPSPAFRMW
jgi:hypothetical protein